MIFYFCSFNIRGLNNKQTYVKDFVSINKLSILAVLETHVKRDSANFISKYVNSCFRWIFNYDFHSNGRIWVGYDPSVWLATVLTSSAQQITCAFNNIASGDDFVVSFIYAFNTAIARRSLWSELRLINQLHINSSRAWCLTGDFNVCLGPSEASNGVNWTTSMIEFSDLLNQIDVEDLRCSGPLFTWWDSNIRSPTYKRLDRCLVNGSLAL